MALQIFAPPVVPSVSGYGDEPEFRLLETEFGDGYTGATPEGLNHIRRVITLSWRLLTPAEAAAIVTFLRSHGGYQAFWWTPSGEETPLKWTCKKYGRSNSHRLRMQVSATFRQDFRLEQ